MTYGLSDKLANLRIVKNENFIGNRDLVFKFTPPLRGLLNNPVQVTGGMEIHAAADTKPVPGL